MHTLIPTELIDIINQYRHIHSRMVFEEFAKHYITQHSPIKPKIINNQISLRDVINEQLINNKNAEYFVDSVEKPTIIIPNKKMVIGKCNGGGCGDHTHFKFKFTQKQQLPADFRIFAMEYNGCVKMWNYYDDKLGSEMFLDNRLGHACTLLNCWHSMYQWEVSDKDFYINDWVCIHRFDTQLDITMPSLFINVNVDSPRFGNVLLIGGDFNKHIGIVAYNFTEFIQHINRLKFEFKEDDLLIYNILNYRFFDKKK